MTRPIGGASGPGVPAADVEVGVYAAGLAVQISTGNIGIGFGVEPSLTLAATMAAFFGSARTIHRAGSVTVAASHVLAFHVILQCGWRESNPLSTCFRPGHSPRVSRWGRITLVHLAVFRVRVSHPLPALVLGFLPGLSPPRDALFRTAP